ncbi:MAG: phytoene desaturase family protein [Phycisphaerales bacterium]
MHLSPSHLASSRTRSDRPSVAVIGAGPGGLSVAMLLAGAGLDVTVIEAQKVVGGRTRRLEAGPYAFDCGPTFFMMPYVLEEIFGSVGMATSDFVEMKRLDPMYRLLIGNDRGTAPTQIDTTGDLQKMAAQLERVQPGDGAAFLRFIADNRKKLALMEPILRSPIRGLADLMTLDGLKVAPTLRPWESIYTHLTRYFKSEESRLAMSFQSKYLGMSPFECPSLFSILPFIEYEYGVWHPIGGCNALVAAMAEACTRLGARIETASPVERITFSGRRATGVVVRGEERRFDHVVVNADATWALKNLIPANLRRADQQDAAIDAKRYSCSTFMLYLGLDGEVDLPHHTIYTSTKYRQNLADIGEGRLSDDASFYVCNPSRLDPTLAPEGDSALYVLVPTANTKAAKDGAPIDWAKAAPSLRAETLARLESVMGIPDAAKRVKAEIMFTPDDWRAQNINHGATFNLAHNITQMLHWRPQHRLQGFDNLWTVGGGTHPGSGLPVIFLASEITSRLLCAECGVKSPLDAPLARRQAPATLDPDRDGMLAGV